jgi:DNA uptake protein ComE-like DNA-binding protein
MVRTWSSLLTGLAFAALLAVPAVAQEPATLNLNTATREELIRYPGIGSAFADKIIAARPFKQRSELVSRGLMPAATYLAIKKYLTPTSEDAKAEAEAAKNRPPAPMWDDRGRININVASHEQLAEIPGIGAAYADKIIQGRPFSSLADLVNRRIMPADAVNALYSKIFAQ